MKKNKFQKVASAFSRFELLTDLTKIFFKIGFLIERSWFSKILAELLTIFLDVIVQHSLETWRKSYLWNVTKIEEKYGKCDKKPLKSVKGSQCLNLDNMVKTTRFKNFFFFILRWTEFLVISLANLYDQYVCG